MSNRFTAHSPFSFGRLSGNLNFPARIRVLLMSDFRMGSRTGSIPPLGMTIKSNPRGI
jgi:hypothetical protein